MVKYSILLFSVLILTTQAQPALLWAHSAGGSSPYFDDAAYTCAVDKYGYVYFAGQFKDTVDFDPGPGTCLLVSDSVYYSDAFVCKMSPAGNLVWAKRMGGWKEDMIHAVAVNGNGDVFVTGSFEGTADFDPGPGTFLLQATSGPSDIFVCKLNAAGNLRWAKQLGGSGWDVGFGIALDKNSNVYTTGLFNNQVDWDPGPSTHILGSGGYCNVFISKLDSAGNYVLAKSFFGNGNDYGYGIATDNSGNIYTTGFFDQTADFDPGMGYHHLTAPVGQANGFVSKLDPLGNFVWARPLSGPGFTAGHSLTADVFGNVYVTGSANGGGNNYGIYAFPTGGGDAFILKLDANGNTIWNNRYGAADACGVSVTCDSKSEIYFTGYFSGSIDLDAGPATFMLNGVNRDVFICRLDNLGRFICGAQQGGSGTDIGYAVALDAMNRIITAGSFSQTADFDPGPAVFNLSAGNYGDAFITKLKDCALGTGEVTHSVNTPALIFPNPNQGEFTIAGFEPGCVITIYTAYGEMLLERTTENADERFNLKTTPGIYLVRIASAGKETAGKLIIN